LLLGRQDIISLPIMMPVLLTILLMLVLRGYADRSKELMLVITCCIASSVLVFSLIASYHWAAARYTYEFIPLLFVPIYCGLVGLWETVRQNNRLRRLTVAVLGLIFCANTLMGLIAGVIAFMYSR